MQIDSYGFDNFPPLSHFINYLKNTECEKDITKQITYKNKVRQVYIFLSSEMDTRAQRS